jgi:hypothetical protein
MTKKLNFSLGGLVDPDFDGEPITKHFKFKKSLLEQQDCLKEVSTELEEVGFPTMKIRKK